MKSQSSTLAAFAAILASPLVSAHYTFPYFVANGVQSSQWQYIRQTQNYNSQGPVRMIDYRCACLGTPSSRYGSGYQRNRPPLEMLREQHGCWNRYRLCSSRVFVHHSCEWADLPCWSKSCLPPLPHHAAEQHVSSSISTCI